MRDKFFYIDYDFEDNERHEKFEIFFQKLKEVKEEYYNAETEISYNDIDWTIYLDENARKWFTKIELTPNSEQRKIYNALWNLTKPEIRHKHPIFNTADNWDFNSVIEVIFQGDYELIKLEKLKDKGTLFFDPGGFPFGGTEALVQLIESFGNKVTYDHWHEGPHIRPEIGWDFEIAKKLVEEGKGVEISKSNRALQIIEKKWWEFWK
ncbi:hypothetical protein GOQ30_00360 [Flavobacterium sp. TP390]|uniref:Uncharacterized protein n=1 Tax=Flavobacterium profundi TaxID=1774945 RepID=A0A6I4IDW9_9FLAO|nr:hypothetical protein [Flavobacterium profundi]MVO07610.1 hypothetical protein [Flavobacterium profundi]